MKQFLAALAALVTIVQGQNTSDQTPSQFPIACSQEIEAWQTCQLKELARSQEGRLMKEKIDTIYQKCAGTMPKNCTTFWRSADQCFHRELDNADSDPQNNSIKRQALQSIDQCYQHTPNDPFADLFEELYPEMLLFDDGGLKTHLQLNIAGRKFVPPPQCAPTLDNLHCVSKEMTSLAEDSEARTAADALRRLKRGCADKLTFQCTPQSHPLWMCVDRALKQLTHLTEEAMQKCMQQKGFTILFRQPFAGNSFGFPNWGLPGNQQMPFAGAAGFPWSNAPFAPNGAGFQGQPRMFDWS